MVRAWQMHFRPAVECWPNFPVWIAQNLPHQAQLSFSGSCCSQTYGHPQHVQSNLENFTGTGNSGAQHKGLIFSLTAGSICSVSLRESFTCMQVAESHKSFLLYHNVGVMLNETSVEKLDCVSSTAAQSPRYSFPLLVHLEEVEQFGGWKGHFLEIKLF